MGLLSGIKDTVGGLAGGLLGYGGANAAAAASKAQQEAIKKAIAEQNAGYAGQQTLFNPYANMGTQGLQHLNALNSGDYSAFENSPDYQYALEQGLGAVDARAGAMGNLFSGGRATALNKEAQGLATQNLGNYRNSLMGQIGIGQWGTGGLSNALGNKTNAISDLLVGVGNAQAAGKIGAANSYSNAASNLMNFASSMWGGGGSAQPLNASSSGYQPSGGWGSMAPAPTSGYTGTFGSYP